MCPAKCALPGNVWNPQSRPHRPQRPQRHRRDHRQKYTVGPHAALRLAQGAIGTLYAATERPLASMVALSSASRSARYRSAMRVRGPGGTWWDSDGDQERVGRRARNGAPAEHGGIPMTITNGVDRGGGIARTLFLARRILILLALDVGSNSMIYVHDMDAWDSGVTWLDTRVPSAWDSGVTWGWDSGRVSRHTIKSTEWHKTLSGNLAPQWPPRLPQRPQRHHRDHRQKYTVGPHAALRLAQGAIGALYAEPPPLLIPLPILRVGVRRRPGWPWRSCR
jgi:hypothetical protein